MSVATSSPPSLPSQTGPSLHFSFSDLYQSQEFAQNFVTMKVVLPNDTVTGILRRSIGFHNFPGGRATRSPTDYTIEAPGCCEWVVAARSSTSQTQVVPASSTTRLLERIRHASELTIEAIAPLAGVSRRTIHSWMSGSAISQRNEERLRALAEAVEAIAEFDTGSVRERLLERVPGSVRIYDLLAEGLFTEATARGTGKSLAPRPLAYPAPRPLGSSLLAQLAPVDAPIIPLGGPLDRRFAKRFRRG
jgi:hypothetical protein